MILEPTINQFHYSFLSESFFFSLMILFLSQIIINSDNKINALLIGITLGVMYLQRTVAILYFLPVFFYFILERKTLKFHLSYFFGFVLILSFLGFHNYQRAGFMYFTPYQSKYDLYAYLIPNVAAKKNSKDSEFDINKLEKELIDFKRINNLDLNSEKDYMLYGAKLRSISINYLLENPIDTFKVMLKKTIHSAVLNPFEVHTFYKYEYKSKNPDLRYYKGDEHKRNSKIRVLYSIIIYSICALGLYSMIIKKKNKNFIFYLIISIMYFTTVGGWIGNPRYLTPNLIFLSVFFAYGFIDIKNKLKLYFN